MNSADLVKILRDLHTPRRENKVTSKRQILSSGARMLILQKTKNRCHVCGISISGKYHADHVKCHSSGSDHNIANYLPSCKVCNRYRWHYSREEIQWILKLGVWARGEIKNSTKLGTFISESFVKHNEKSINRKSP